MNKTIKTMYIILKVLSGLSILSLASNIVFPQYAYAASWELNQKEVETVIEDVLTAFYGNALVQSANPNTPEVVEVRWVTVTAYSSTVDQTDSSPFISASGKRVYDGMVACNFLRFGTRVRFPELSQAKVYEVEDRMALKNSHKIDIWFETREEAKQFGVKTLKVEILEA